MKFAFCVEDRTDQEVFAGILQRVLDEPVDPKEERYRFEMRGFSNALKLAPIIARKAYHSGLDGAVFAIDNDGALQHTAAHEASPDTKCRLCELRKAAKVEEPLGWPRPGLPSLQYLFTVPTQTIETWLLHMSGHDFKGMSEALGADANGRKRLKALLYGMADPDTRTMLETARPLVEKFDPRELAARSESFRYFLDQIERTKAARPPSAMEAASSHE